VLSYLWDFGDGETDTAPNPVHTFVDPGSYTVTLEVTDDHNLTDLASAVVTVDARANYPPEAYIATVNGAIDKPGDVTLDASISTDLDADSLTYTWTISQDGEPMEFDTLFTGPILTIRFRLREPMDFCAGLDDPCLGPGIYEVVVRAEDGFGGTDTSEPTVLVFAPDETGGSSVIGPIDEGEGGPGQEIPITGSSGGGRGGGLCGIGILMPTMLTALAMVATVAARRRRW
jgi:hypothetical protein